MADKLTKHSLFLREGDFAQLKAMFPRTGASAAVRKIVSSALDNAEKKTTPISTDTQNDE